VERISAKEEPDLVRDYVTLLCAIQLLEVLSREEPDFCARENLRFSLIVEARRLLDCFKLRFTSAGDEEHAQFFEWFERWFLRRANPAPQELVT
jgi:hypothetical protein